MRERENRGGREPVRFIVREAGLYDTGNARISFPAHGLFVDGQGKPIGAIVDMKDRFRRHTAGVNFSVEDGHRALKGWLGRQLDHDERQRLWWDVRRSGLPRRARAELKRMRVEFARQTVVVG